MAYSSHTNKVMNSFQPPAGDGVTYHYVVFITYYPDDIFQKVISCVVLVAGLPFVLHYRLDVW